MGKKDSGRIKKKKEGERLTMGESYNRASVPVLDSKKELRLQQQRAGGHWAKAFYETQPLLSCRTQ